MASINSTDDTLAVAIKVFLGDKKFKSDMGIYCRMANGNLAAAIILQKAAFWSGIGENGEPRMKVIKGEHRWWAISMKQIEREFEMKTDKANRAIKHLVNSDLLVRGKWKFNGSPTTHLRIFFPVFLLLYAEEREATGLERYKDEVEYEPLFPLDVSQVLLEIVESPKTTKTESTKTTKSELVVSQETDIMDSGKSLTCISTSLSSSSLNNLDNDANLTHPINSQSRSMAEHLLEPLSSYSSLLTEAKLYLDAVEEWGPTNGINNPPLWVNHVLEDVLKEIDSLEFDGMGEDAFTYALAQATGDIQKYQNQRNEHELPGINYMLECAKTYCINPNVQEKVQQS